MPKARSTQGWGIGGLLIVLVAMIVAADDELCLLAQARRSKFPSAWRTGVHSLALFSPLSTNGGPSNATAPDGVALGKDLPRDN
jgi:hypothetical protein